MAKIVKKKPVAKAAAKPAKKAPAKAAAKPAPAKKAAPPKTVVKKKVEKAPVKAAKKPEAKKKVETKVDSKAKAPVVVAKPSKEVKVEATKEVAKKTPVKAAPQPVVEKPAPKKEAKVIAKKGKGKGKEKEKEKDESDLDDDFIADDDMMGDEIGEYEEELKAVEESEEEIEVLEDWTGEEKLKSDEEVILTDAEGRRYCRARDCDQIAIVDAYCRFHYLMFWKKIQIRKKILMDGKLERYIDELTARYPDKFLEMIRRDLRTEKDFLAAIQELEIDESAGESEFEEDTSAFIEEVRGMGEGSSGVEEDEY